VAITKYIYDGDAVLQETDGSGATQKTYTRTGGGYGDLLSVYDGSAAKYFEPDALGSTAALADQTQTVVDRWQYRAFGSAAQTTGTDAIPFTWVGRIGYVSDAETDLYLLGSGTRYYATDVNQFLSEDPIGFAGGDANIRRYVGSNPIRFVDPMGFKYTAICAFLIGEEKIDSEEVECKDSETPKECCTRRANEWGWRTWKVFRAGRKPVPLPAIDESSCEKTCKDRGIWAAAKKATFIIPKQTCLLGAVEQAIKVCEVFCVDNPSCPSNSDPKAGAKAFDETWKEAVDNCDLKLKKPPAGPGAPKR
jgi:RHS repeat-associated protein